MNCTDTSPKPSATSGTTIRTISIEIGGTTYTITANVQNDETD